MRQTLMLATMALMTACGANSGNTPWDQNHDGLISACEGLNLQACDATPGCGHPPVLCQMICLDDGQGGCLNPCGVADLCLPVPPPPAPLACDQLSTSACSSDPACEVVQQTICSGHTEPVDPSVPSCGVGPCQTITSCVTRAPAQCEQLDSGVCLAHPGCALVPAALATGEQFGISGTHFLCAVTLGYDVAMRAMRTVGPGMKETHPLVGTMGATAAAGCVASLNAQQMRWLLDYAAQQAGAGIGSWRRDTDHIEKAFVFGGMGARNGVTAALAVRSGWTGVDDVLSGPNNFVETYNPKADPAGMIDKLGEVYGVTQTTLKKWTTGGPIQAPLDALQALLKRSPFQADQVKQVVIRVATSAGYTVNNRDMPDICLQHLVAVMLLDRTVSFRAAHDKLRMQDAAVSQQRVKVQLAPDEELEKLIPLRVAIVEVTLKDGTKLSERVEHVRGTPENPMTTEEVLAKARELMTPVLGAATTSKLVERVMDIENMKDIRDLRPLLQAH